VFAVSEVGGAEFEIGEIDLVFELASADEEVAGFDVAVQYAVAVQIFHSF
jgi:hypothetical protein